MNIIETNLTFGPLSKRKSTKKIIAHHAEAESCTVEDIHRWHKDKGWSGIGYHFFIKKNGSIYRGRPIDTIGSHCLNQNSNSVGVCLEGCLTSESPTQEQINCLKELIAYLKGVYGNIPVKGHKEFIATSCPGSLMDYMEELNEAMQASIPAQEDKRTWEYYINGDLIQRLQHELNVQFSARIKEDGYLGDQSLEALKGVAIKRGSKGKLTKTIQERLLQLGYNLPKFGADSDFGAETENTLRKFQGDRGLNIDGIAGINTFKALLKKIDLG